MAFKLAGSFQHLRKQYQICEYINKGLPVGQFGLCRCSSSNVRSAMPMRASAAHTPTHAEDVDHVASKDYTGTFYRERTLAAISAKKKKPLANVPFVKNLFLGRFDEKMLVFPEVLSKEELADLENMVLPIEKFFNEKVDSKTIDASAAIPEEVLKQLKEFGLFGQQIPAEYGGLGLNATQCARLSEVTVLDSSVFVTMTAHQGIGLKGILLAGTAEQKEKYLPKLATGEHLAAFCLTEANSGSDAASIQMTATRSPDGKTYLLNGEKIWISNGGIADVFTVFAKMKVDNNVGQKEERITAFIVERAFGGITSGKSEDKMGIRGSNTCSVHFDNTPVPAANVLGEVGGGFKVALTILNSGRFSMGSSIASVLRKLLGMTAEHAIQRKQFGKELVQFAMIQEKFAEMALKIYAMESMSYMTAAMMDSYEHADTSVEAAIVKVFSSEASWDATSQCMQIMGGAGYMKAMPYERYLRDSRISMIFEGTNEILRLYIALTGLQHAGIELNDTVAKLRNPLNNVGLIFKKSIERFQTNRKNPRLRMHLYRHIHPNFSYAGEALEVRVIRFQYVVEKYLSTFAGKIIEEQLALKRMADVVIDIYAITACIARASRSICIGLRHHDHEVELTMLFCQKALHRIDQNIQELDAGKHENTDHRMCKLAEHMLKHRGYTAVHPLTRNW